MQRSNVDSSRRFGNVSQLKGNILVGCFLGLALLGVGIIWAHSTHEYAGLGEEGIHAIKGSDGTIHIPNGIYLGYLGDFTHHTEIYPENQGIQTIMIPSLNGTFLVINKDSQMPECDESLTGQMYVAESEIIICVNDTWQRLQTLPYN